MIVQKVDNITIIVCEQIDQLERKKVEFSCNPINHLYQIKDEEKLKNLMI
jgi:hypothetical protein